MTPEGKVRQHLRKRAIAVGFEHRKLKWIGRRGAPDEMLFWPEGPPLVACLVEVKRPGEDIDPKSPQGREIDRLRKAGWYVVMINSTVGADLLISSLTTLVRGAEVPRTKGADA